MPSAVARCVLQGRLHRAASAVHSWTMADPEATDSPLASRSSDLEPFSDDYPRSSRAAATIAPTFAAAMSHVFIGRFENVPKPQSGFRKIWLGA